VVFESVTVVVFKSAFRLKMHKNNIYIFYFFKIIFYISILKRSENIKKFILSKKQNSIFHEIPFGTQFQIVPWCHCCKKLW